MSHQVGNINKDKSIFKRSSINPGVEKWDTWNEYSQTVTADSWKLSKLI